MPGTMTPRNGNVVRFARPRVVPPSEAKRQKRECSRYIREMLLELERMSTTAELEVLSYFLAMARAEATASAISLGEDQG